MSRPRTLWDDDLLQFTRLLAEINAVDLTIAQRRELCENMDVEPHQLDELFERAQERYEASKQTLGPDHQPCSLDPSPLWGIEYTFRGEDAWIHATDPNHVRRGMDIHLTRHDTGVTIAVSAGAGTYQLEAPYPKQDPAPRIEPAPVLTSLVPGNN